MSAPQLAGVSHVALNVRDLESSVTWYCDVLGFVVLFPFDTDDFERRILVHPSGVAVALTQHRRPDPEGFSERRLGLDHLSFAVPAKEELERWAERLDAAGVTHSGVAVTPQTGSALLAFRDPDGIALELYIQVGAPSA